MSPAIIARLREFVERDGPVIQAYALKLTGTRADAEDLAQETYRKVLRQWPHHVWPLKPWCMTIVKHLHLDALRRAERKRSVSLDAPMSTDGPSLQSVIPDSGQTPEQLLERQETIEFVRRALRRMNAIHRNALALCDLEGASYREAARALRIPLGTLRSRVFRARRAFRAMFPELAHV